MPLRYVYLIMPFSHPSGILILLAFSVSILFTAGECKAQEIPVALPDSVRTDTTTQKFDERVMEKLRELSERKTIMGKLLKAVLVFDRQDEVITGLDAELIEREYEKHNYKIVRSIEVVSLNPFGYAINDSTRVPRNIMEKAGNALHIKTDRRLIRNKLLFQKDEPLEPLALVESERLLRQTQYILDTRIIVNEATTTDDSVDVYIVTKDIFSLGGSGSYSPSSGSGRVALRELNFLGQGHQLRTSYRFNMVAPRPWELAGEYTVENIGRTYISADIRYINQNYLSEKSAFLRRDFYSTNTKYAGAVGVSWMGHRLQFPRAPGDTAPRFDSLAYTQRDFWLGRAFKFKSYNLGFEPRGRLIVGIRAIETNYQDSPTDTYQDNTLLLTSIGYSIRRYYKDRYLYGFGRTEDIPAGTRVSFLLGQEFRQLVNRRYVGTELSFAKYASKFGYFFGRAAYSSFIRTGKWEQGVLELEALYFTRLYEQNNWKLRHFFIGRTTYGVNRNPEELLTINGADGLRGFRSDLLRGSRRVVVNYEANLYTPLSLFGFRLATVAFADLAWLSTGNSSSPFKETPYHGYGVGVRFRNEYLSLSTIQIMIGYYPRMPFYENHNNFRIFDSSRPYYEFEDFRFNRPGVAQFR